MSAKDKSGLGYGNQIHEGVLSYENEVLESIFVSRSSDVKDSPVNDRFAKDEGMHAVPPSMTGIYMPPKSDFGIDESKFTYGPKQSKTSESETNTSDFASCESDSSVETLESVPKPAVNEPKVIIKPKVSLMLLSLRNMSPKEANQSAGTQDTIDAGNSQMETEPAQKYFVLPVWSSYTSTVKSSEEKNGDVKPNGDNGLKTNEKHKDQGDQAFLEELERLKRQERRAGERQFRFKKVFDLVDLPLEQAIGKK
ncbi:hypothetical protein Tco_1061119 [Tanacetum coccineum]